MKSLMSLWSCAANELAARCCTSATRDIKYVSSRVEHEGLWFLAVTLADYGKATQKWLDRSQVDPSDVPGFRNPIHRTGLPPFLGGFLGRVFDPSSGVLLDEPDIEAIYAIRQLTLMFSKIALPSRSLEGNGTQVVTPVRERRAMSEFIQCEQEVRESDDARSSADIADFCRISDMLYRDLFSDLDRKVFDGELIPKHGPGATAEKLSSNGKYNQRTWPSRLERIFPYGENVIPNWRYYDQLEEVDFLEPDAEIPVRVITVPKTLKTPRIIAIEPTAMQYMQQAIRRDLYDAIEGDRLLSRMIGLTDQEPNRQLAAEGSFSGDLATLDLSEASDRVSNQLVRAMLRNHPHLLEAVDSTRSRKADVPGHGVIRLAKFASMGSALCFPFEAMVFLTLILLGIERESNTPLSRKSIEMVSGQVRVFGDDLIVPVRHVLSVVDSLQSFGTVVNIGKSYWTGKFRESCGREYFNGQDVSIVKVRQVLPTQRQDADGIVAAVALRNLLYRGGLWQSCRWLDAYVERLIPFPTVLPTSPILGRDSFLGYTYQKLDPNTHGPLSRGYYVSAESPTDPLEGPGALVKCLLRSESLNRESSHSYKNGSTDLGGSPPVDEEHLERSGRPKRVSIKLGWRSSV